MRISDWSSDVCSSDLQLGAAIRTVDIGDADVGVGGKRRVLKRAGVLLDRLGRLAAHAIHVAEGEAELVQAWVHPRRAFAGIARVLVRLGIARVQIGRESGRESVCQYV